MHLSILSRTVIGIAVIEAFFLTLLIYLVLKQIGAVNFDMMKSRADSEATLFSLMVTEPVLAFDLAAVDAFVSQVTQNDEIAYARVFDAKGQSLVGEFTPEAKSDSELAEIDDGVLHISKKITLEGTDFGSVEIGYRVSWFREFLSSIKERAIMIALLEIMVVALVSVLFGRWLLRSIRVMSAAVARIGQGDLTTPIDVPNRDEISSALVELEKMRASLEERSNALQQAQRTRNQMYGIIAHELRTPVAAIEMMTNHEGAEWSKDRDLIRTAAHDLLHSIDDMKMLVNPDLKREQHIESVTTENLNRSISAMVASAVATAGVLYQQMTLLPERMGRKSFATDAYRVKAAVTNLVRNACLHSEGSRVSCLTSLTTDESGRDFIQWTVSDNGKGIPDDKVSGLFEPFARGDSKAEGTGLGLHIARSWIEEIGGTLEYRKIPLGSEFVVLVPFESEESKLATKSAADSLTQAKSLASQLRILLVEDDKVLQMVTHQMLSKIFVSVEVASDGVQGVERAAEGFDLILADYFMPNMTGVEMAATLRAQGFEQPIVGATAATIAGQDQEMLDAGMNKVLLKPINTQMVLRTIQELHNEGYFRDDSDSGAGA